MNARDRMISGIVLIILFMISIHLNFFPSKYPPRRGYSRILYVGSPMYPYARVLFPILFVALYIIRRKKKDEMTIEQEMRIWSNKDK